MLIMFCIMISAYLVIVGVYSLYKKIHEWRLQRKSRGGRRNGGRSSL